MIRELLDAVRAETSGERALESVRALARFHRVQASPGYDEAARWLEGEVRALGVPLTIERVPGDGRTRYLGHLMPEGWECTHARARLVDGAHRDLLCDYEAQRLSLVLRSDSARGRFRIVDAGEGTREADYDGIDVRGAVVLVSGGVQRAHQLAVIDRHAAGLLTDGRRLVPPVRVADTDVDAFNYTSFWWNGDEPRGWGFVIPPSVGRRLRSRLGSGAPLELEAEIDSRRFTTELPLLSAVLPGEAPGEVLIVAHLCHPQACANDNASGVAASLETLRVLVALRARGVLPANGRSVRFLWMPEFTGTYAWLARDPERPRRVVAALNLDMVGEDQEQCGSTLLLEHPPCFSASFSEALLSTVRAQSLDWVSSFLGPGQYSMTRVAEVPYSGGSDHAVLVDPAIGVPCPMLIQWPDRYYHSSSDTPDKTDPRSLALAARCAAAYAAIVAGIGATSNDAALATVGRYARVRMIQTLDREDASRQFECERLRGITAIRSMARLAIAPDRVTEAIARLEAFATRERGALAPAAPPAWPKELAVLRPRRRLRAPLHYQRFLIDGWRTLPRATREQWRALEEHTPDGLLIAELGWFACDGARTLGEIARLVWLETGVDAGSALQEFFTYTAELGLTDWDGAAVPAER